MRTRARTRTDTHTELTNMTSSHFFWPFSLHLLNNNPFASNLSPVLYAFCPCAQSHSTL